MTNELSAAQRLIGDVAPKLAGLTDDVVFGDVWERPEMSKRHRSLINGAALVSRYRPEQLPGHLWRAIDNGVTRDELAELVTHPHLLCRLAQRRVGPGMSEGRLRRARRLVIDQEFRLDLTRRRFDGYAR